MRVPVARAGNTAEHPLYGRGRSRAGPLEHICGSKKQLNAFGRSHSTLIAREPRGPPGVHEMSWAEVVITIFLRWQEFRSGAVILDRTGRSFEEMPPGGKPRRRHAKQAARSVLRDRGAQLAI